MKNIFILMLLCSYFVCPAQELYVYSEPASNMPAHSLSPKLSYNFGENGGQFRQRYTPELMFGFHKKLMVHVSTTFSNMNTERTKWESVYAYGKYRFLSIDDIHKHFRMAAFTAASYSKSVPVHDDMSLQGDRSGIGVGLIATQLINRLAFSATVGYTQALDRSRFETAMHVPRSYQAANYSLSAGILLLPREYNSYKQLNVNFYTELLGQQTIDRRSFYTDLAPSLQFIFNSNSKLNMGYRFQLGGNQLRSLEKSFLLSFEHTFFNALKKHRR